MRKRCHLAWAFSALVALCAPLAALGLGVRAGSLHFTATERDAEEEHARNSIAAYARSKGETAQEFAQRIGWPLVALEWFMSLIAGARNVTEQDMESMLKTLEDLAAEAEAQHLDPRHIHDCFGFFFGPPPRCPAACDLVGRHFEPHSPPN